MPSKKKKSGKAAAKILSRDDGDFEMYEERMRLVSQGLDSK